MIDSALVTAYRGTSYRVAAGGQPFAIRIDTPCEPLDALLAARGVTTWAYVTACNPRSQRLADDENFRRMARLEAVIRDRGYEFLAGEAVADAAGWPAERSLLVFGVGEREAVEIARDFAQHAVVVGRCREPARLAWT